MQEKCTKFCFCLVFSYKKSHLTMLDDLVSCGGRNRTNDLQVMSLTSYHCSTPRYITSCEMRCKGTAFF